MNAKTLVRTSAAALAMSAGLALAQPTTAPAGQPRTPDAHRHDLPAQATTMQFVKLGQFTGMDVENSADEDIGEIKDLVIARGSGRVEYVLIEGGGVVGIGGKTIALPYHALRYDPVEDEVITDLTREQFEAAAEFVPENWSDLEHSTWTDEVATWWDQTIMGNDPADEGEIAADRAERAERARIAAADAIAVNGNVARVWREDIEGQEHILIEVQPVGAIDEVEPRTIVLGPSWYVMGDAGAPMRGDQANLRVYADDEGDNRWIALSGTIDNQQVSFRGDQGEASWDSTGDDGANRSPHAGRLMLASALVGADARASDEDGGEIQNVILECTSGQIAFIGFDPNENVMGWGDKIILVPWTLVSINADHEARIDATRDMLLASEPVPDDLDVLTHAPRPGSLYATYGVDLPRFEARQPDGRRDFAGGSGPWSEHREIAQAFAQGPTASLTGRIKEVTTETILPGTPEATVLVIGTETGDRRVVLGPKAFVAQHALNFRTDQTVLIRGTTAMLNGREYVGARSIMVDGRTVEVWTGDDWDND